MLKTAVRHITPAMKQVAIIRSSYAVRYATYLFAGTIATHSNIVSNGNLNQLATGIGETQSLRSQDGLIDALNLSSAKGGLELLPHVLECSPP